MAELSILQEEIWEFGKMRIFQGITILPVLNDEVTLSKEKLAVLSKNPKFAVRAKMDRERYLAEFEKGLCKKKYSDIGKEIVDGKTVVEEAVSNEDKRIEK